MTVGELLAKLGIDTTPYEQGLARVERQTRASSLRLGDIFEGALSVTLGIGFFEAIRRGFQAVVGEAINFNSMMEQAQIGFTTMLGSAEKAQAFLEQMGEFAARTPFEYPDLLEASRRMMAMGFAAGEVLPTLRAVGDAAAGLGLGKVGIDRITLALGQMRAKAKVTGEEMRQLTEAGVPAWEILAEAMGKSTAEVMKLSEKGLIPASQAIQVLIEGMEKRFPNMMENMQNTWQGVTSTIKDVWRMTIGALTSGLFRGLTGWLQRIRDLATTFYTTFSNLRRQGLDTISALQIALAQAFGPNVAASVSMVAGALRSFWAFAVGVAKAIIAHWSVIRPLVIWAATAFLTFKVAIPIINGLTLVVQALNGTLAAGPPLFTFIARAIQIYQLQLHLASMAGITHIGVIQALRTALYSLYAALGPLGVIIMAISAALGIGIGLWSKYSAAVMRANTAKVLGATKSATDSFNQSIRSSTSATQQQSKALNELGRAQKKQNKATNDNIQSFDEVHQIMEQTVDAAEGAAAGLGEVAAPSLEVPTGVGAIALPEIDMGALEQAKPTWSGFWQWIVDSVKEKWNSFKEWVASWAGPLWDGIKAKWAGFKEWAGGLWEGVKAKWDSFKGWIAGWAGPLWDGIKAKWSSFKEWAANLWEGAKGKWGDFTAWVSSKWSAFKDEAGILWNNIKNIVQSKWQELSTSAPGFWENIKTTIANKWNELKTNAPLAWENIKATIQMKWQELQTNAPIAWENIKASISTRWDNLKANAGPTWENIKTAIASRWETLKANAPVMWESIKTSISTRWEELKASAPGTWENIKQAITSRFGSARDRVVDAAQQIKDRVVQSWGNMLSKVTSLKDLLYSRLVDPFARAKEKILSIVDTAREWGRNFIDNIVAGIRSAIDAVKRAGGAVATALMRFLGFSSPTEEGPGRYADRWAPNFMRMYAEGILSNVGMVKAAVATVAESLAGVTAAPAPVFAGGGGARGGFTPVTAPEIHLHIGTLIADDYGLKKLEQRLREIRIFEEQRLGQEKR